MIKLSYNFKTRGPLHTGSDVNAGTMRTLRRQKCILAKPLQYTSTLSDAQRRDAVIRIALGVWYEIDWNSIKGTQRLMGIWDEFANKLMSAAHAPNKYVFLNKLCHSWGISSITDPEVLSSMDLLSDHELIDTIRNELMYIILKMRAVKESTKKDNVILRRKRKFDLTIPPSVDQEEHTITRTEDEIPCISGNSIRGKLRRLSMHDFCNRVGIHTLDKRVYHTLFTGGFLDQSTRNEDLEKMEQFVAMCPALGLFGAAIGNMTIEGEMKVGWAYPLCKERGTGKKSYWQYLDTVFQTRHDSSKTEKEIELTGEEQVQQMKYEYEVFADGTPFEHRIACTSENPLIISTFWHSLKLFDTSPYLGGMGAVGNGEIVPDWDLAGNNEEYLKYLEENKETIKEFWKNATI